MSKLGSQTQDEQRKSLIKDLVCFDLETTGWGKSKDRITQIGAVRMEYVEDEGRYIIKDEFKTLVNPGSDARWMESAMEKTGITAETVKDAPNTKTALEDFIRFLGDSDVLTYNGTTFDIPILKAECRRVGIDVPMFITRNCYDGYVIESKLAPRDLGSIYKKYSGSDMDTTGLTAHDALNDVKATVYVFNKQLRELRNREMEIDGDISIGIIGKNDKDQWQFIYGKHKGVTVQEVIKEDPSYITWVIKETGDKDIFTIIKGEYEWVQSERNKEKNLKS